MKRLIKIILLVVNVLVLLLLLGSTMAGKVSPTKFIGFSLLSYGYLYFLIANILFVVLWLCMSSKWFLLSLAAILLRFSFLPLYFQVGGTETAEGTDKDDAKVVKIMTFNTHRFYGVEDFETKEGEMMVDSNMRMFLDIVDQEEPDVLTMQEYVSKGKEVKLTKQLTKRGYIYQASGCDDNSMKNSVVFSKLPIQRVVRIEGPTKLYVNLLLGEDTLRLYCFHLTSYGLAKSDQQQIREISHGNVDSLSNSTTLKKFSTTIRTHEREWEMLKPFFEARERLTVVTGDFNDPPASYFYQQCKAFFKDSYCEVGQGFSTTYHGSFTRSHSGTFPAFRIDMILHTPDIKAVSYKRIKSEVSDHYPVVAVLKF